MHLNIVFCLLIWRFFFIKQIHSIMLRGSRGWSNGDFTNRQTLSFLTIFLGVTPTYRSETQQTKGSTHKPIHFFFNMYSEILLLQQLKIKTSYLSKTLFAKFELFFSSVFLHPMYFWLETTFGTVQKWS